MIRYMYKNLKTLTLFQLSFNLLCYGVLVPILKWIFKISILISGINNLTEVNFLIYLRHPLSIVIDLVILFIITVTTLMYFNALVVIYIASKNKKSITLYSLLIATYENSKDVFKLRNVSLFLYVVVALPYFNIIYKNPVIKNLNVPSFILESVRLNNLYIFIYIILSLFLILYVIHNAYVFFYMLIGKMKYGDARRASKNLIKKTKKDMFVSLVKIVVLGAIMLGICVAFQYLFYGICRFINNGILFKILVGVFSLMTIINSTIYHIVTNVYGTYLFGELYFENENPFDLKIDYDRAFNIPSWLKLAVAAVVILILAMLGWFQVYNDVRADVAVVAHRGASGEELENTKEAFMKAQAEGAEYIELDVTLTEDNQVVIVHDANLKRLGGVDKFIDEMTYDEIKQIPIYNEEKTEFGQIMLLKDLLPMINPDVKLIIEIKPIDGDGKECVQAVERLLTFYPRHYIACLDISILKEAKRLNPLRKTVYLLAFALGNWYNYDCVDIYAIEQSFASEENVELVHKNKNQIFVWNVNDEKDAFRYLELGVDGLITNYPKKILSTVNSSQLQLQSENLLNFFKVSL